MNGWVAGPLAVRVASAAGGARESVIKDHAKWLR